MVKINFEDRTEQIEIAEKVYSLCVSNYEFVKKAQENMKELEEAQKDMVSTGDVDTLVNTLKRLINFTLDNDFDRIWEACHHDIYGLLDVTTALAEIIQKGFEYKASKYV